MIQETLKDPYSGTVDIYLYQNWTKKKVVFTKKRERKKKRKHHRDHPGRSWYELSHHFRP